MANQLNLTHLDKIYWPKEKITKGELLNYYGKIAPVILSYLKNRPESLNRFPHGVKGPSFYQKDVGNLKVPPFVTIFKHWSESNSENIRWTVCNNSQSLLYLVNLGCIELNPWSSTVKRPNNPDWLVIDLDPDGNNYNQVVEAALVTRKILDKIGAPSFPKTSGKTGMHIYVPTKGKYSFDQVRVMAEIVANLVHRQLPKFTSVERMPKKRKGKIYVDFLQNRIGQTLAAPYSVRPWPNATVSTPLQWKEVKRGLDPNKFTIKNVFARLDKYGDLWQPVLKQGVNLKQLLAELSRVKS